MLKTVNLKGDITEIYSGAFEDCTSLKNISLSDKIEVLYDDTFANCKSLKTVTLPKNLKEIHNYVFYECESLKKVVLPKTLTRIGNRAFAGCTSLSKITIPKNVTYVGKNAFTTAMTITVENSDINWHSCWCDRNITTFTNKPKGTVNATLKQGMYKNDLYDEYIYIDGHYFELISFMVRYKYTYETEGNLIKCYPADGNIRLFKYDEKTGNILYEEGNYRAEFRWYSSARTITPSYYLDY